MNCALSAALSINASDCKDDKIKQLTLAGKSALLVAAKLLVDVHAHELATNLRKK